MKASVFRFGLNVWPPFLLTGIHVDALSADYRHARVEMRLRFWNRNYVGTHFGGSLFAMTDPFWMLLVLHQLGRDHFVWDKSAEIEFVKPGRGTVWTRFDLDDATLAGLRNTIRRVILLGPTHRVAVRGLALPTSDAFATPLGVVPIDKQAVDAVSDLPQVVFSDAAHAHEHSLEVEIPFLQVVLEDFSLLPLAVGDASPGEVAEVLERLWGGRETLIVISSDLSHYLPYHDAQHIDTRTAHQIVGLDPMINHYQACGATPINGLLLAARKRGLQVRQLDLRNSGDTAGDRSRVVGYGAFGFFEPAEGEQHHVH